MSPGLNEVTAAAVAGAPFSSSDDGYAWMSVFCDRCLRDAPFRNGINDTGCPILLVAMTGRTPAQWRGERNGYQCAEFRPVGSRAPKPRARREPRSMSGLFDRPARTARTLVEPRAEQ